MQFLCKLYAIDPSNEVGGCSICALCFAGVGGVTFEAWVLGIPDMP